MPISISRTNRFGRNSNQVNLSQISNWADFEDTVQSNVTDINVDRSGIDLDHDNVAITTECLPQQPPVSPGLREYRQG